MSDQNRGLERAMLDWLSSFAFGLWLLGGLILGTVHPALGGLFMLIAYVGHLLYGLKSK
ncbi:hypothetical protein AMC83_PA00054 (plasmid) [Rhizobium phaseoli]|nr:hypothetical protein AMC83_PA00054 [Rhizobium phaseoli]